jgi:hypothetical protein
VYTGFWWGNLRVGDHLQVSGYDGEIILGWIFRKWEFGGMDWIDPSQDRDTVAGTCECGNKPSGSIK